METVMRRAGPHTSVDSRACFPLGCIFCMKLRCAGLAAVCVLRDVIQDTRSTVLKRGRIFIGE
eukprot:1254665-Pleurochrysis_carterae.AAC.1